MIKILYEDEYIIACKKEPGMISEFAESEDSLPAMLKKEKHIDVFTLHRLDKPVGGAIIYAKTKKAAASFSALVADNKITKNYIAVLDGIPEKDDGMLSDLLFKDSRSNKTFVVKRNRKGVKEAVLSYKTLMISDNHALVSVILQTGRSHQIRVQFASRKMPITGDGKYGSRDNKCTVALWSHSLEFIHPFTHNQIKIESLPNMNIYPWNLFKKQENDFRRTPEATVFD